MLKCYGVSDFALSLETPGGSAGESIVFVLGFANQ
jgi:hypothetical protein